MDADQIVATASAFYASATLFAALDCGVFTALERTHDAAVEKLAADLKADRRGLRLLLDGCVALGLLVKENERYRNTPAAAETLVPGAPRDLTSAIRYNQDVYGAWGRLSTLVRTGHPVEAPENHLGADPERTRRFVMAMHGRAAGIGRAIVPLLDLGGARRLLDVGGGPGTYSMLMAQATPGLHCTVIDLPGVVTVAQELIAAAGMGGRVATLAGDYHNTTFPKGADAVTFFGVLHQEAPAEVAALLRRAYTALAPGGTIHVMDMMTDPTHTQPAFSALFAINMALTTTNGWVFSEKELGDWLEAAGFVDVRSQRVPPPMPHNLVSARKPAAPGEDDDARSGDCDDR